MFVERLKRTIKTKIKNRMMQRLSPHVFSAIYYFRKWEAGYSAYRLLYQKKGHGLLKKLRSIRKQTACNEVRK
jgi:hypothetical protein